MANTQKIKKAAIALFTAVSLVLLWFIIQTIRGIVLNMAEWQVPTVATFSIGVLLVIATLIFAFMLLHSIKNDETPFNGKNVTHLKIIAVLLIALEPYLIIVQWIFHNFYPIVLSDGISIETHSSMGGSIIAAGLVVYYIALVFDYGISLQQQVDETL